MPARPSESINSRSRPAWNLDINRSAKSLENFLKVCTEELKDFARLTGNDDVHKLSIDDLCTTSSEMSEHMDIEHV